MNLPDQQPHEPRPSMRLATRLDTGTPATRKALVAPCHASHASVRRQVMGWGSVARRRARSAGPTPKAKGHTSEALAGHVKPSSAASMRPLIAQATREQFPERWPLAAAERRPWPARALGPIQERV